METPAVVQSKSPPRHRLRDIVESYMKNRIPRDLHPSYQAIDDKIIAESRPSPPAYSQTEPILVSDHRYLEEFVHECENEEEFSL